MEYILLVLIFLLTGLLFYLKNKNKKLTAQKKALIEKLELKDIIISTLQSSHVSAKDDIENFSTHDKVMELIDAGESRESVSEKLGIPTSRIELIIKFDKIKKEHDR